MTTPNAGGSTVPESTRVREGDALYSPRPGPSAPRPYHFPRFERRELGNGVRLVVAPVRTLPLVSVVALVEAGASGDPRGLEGVSQLVARAILEGSAEWTGAELVERLEGLGTSLESGADWDSAVFRMTVAADRFAEALEVLAGVLRSPTFPEREVERLKGERVAEIMAERAEPRGLADEAFDRVSYSPESRYAEPQDGSAGSVGRIGRAEVVRQYGERYRPGGVTLIVAGDVDVPGVERLVGRVLGDWRGGVVEKAVVVDRPARSGRGVYLVAKAEAAQSELRIGHVGVPRSDPGYFPASVMNAILGGLFSSRINLNLREAHGYTYGAFSGFDWRRGAGPWVVSTAVRGEVTVEAAREVLAEIERMRGEAPSDGELTLATSYLDGVFPIRYETTSSIASALANLVVFGLPDDYYDSYRTHIRQITPADVLDAARRYLRPEALQILVVGDPAVVREPLGSLGAVEVVELDGGERAGQST